MPIIAPIGVDDAGQTYNCNADTAAGAIAGALKAHRLLLLTDVVGVLDKDKNLLRQLDSIQVGESTTSLLCVNADNICSAKGGIVILCLMSLQWMRLA